MKLGGVKTDYKYDGADRLLLERFVNPLNLAGQWEGTINIEAPEFTSLCPITGQPDFAMIVINYTPGKWCVESKSLKLYLGSYRMHGDFHESCVQKIADDLVRLLNPISLDVEGRFTPRGGIPFWPLVRYTR